MEENGEAYVLPAGDVEGQALVDIYDSFTVFFVRSFPDTDYSRDMGISTVGSDPKDNYWLHCFCIDFMLLLRDSCWISAVRQASSPRAGGGRLQRAW